MQGHPARSSDRADLGPISVFSAPEAAGTPRAGSRISVSHCSRCVQGHPARVPDRADFRLILFERAVGRLAGTPRAGAPISVSRCSRYVQGHPARFVGSGPISGRSARAAAGRLAGTPRAGAPISVSRCSRYVQGHPARSSDRGRFQGRSARAPAGRLAGTPRAGAPISVSRCSRYVQGHPARLPDRADFRPVRSGGRRKACRDPPRGPPDFGKSLFPLCARTHPRGRRNGLISGRFARAVAGRLAGTPRAGPPISVSRCSRYVQGHPARSPDRADFRPVRPGGRRNACRDPPRGSPDFGKSLFPLCAGTPRAGRRNGPGRAMVARVVKLGAGGVKPAWQARRRVPSVG